ncbi:hypothetical protein [Thalassotalea profundi]|uniref:Uncharacterized protein n=1 Tax=Thalassotalea profundi TaxID=2036687 RepID=A0ABQ3J3M5_9GAMM|nr:hypothetical protein [Thalassotalea profundi]GHF03070.1 hypothetical protein GCM10011501_35330 [Thalassotalea profundi]
MSFTAVLLLALILLLPVVYFTWAFLSLKKDMPDISDVWKNLDSFNKYLIKMGLVLLIPVPYLKSIPEKDLYPVAFCIELLPALATGFFVTGVIAYSKAMYDHKQKNT